MSYSNAHTGSLSNHVPGKTITFAWRDKNISDPSKYQDRDYMYFMEINVCGNVLVLYM